MTEQFTVAAAAKEAGLTPRAVRLYEAKGLVGPAQRAPNGYRLFTGRDVERLRFVRRARSLGLSLEAAAEILDAATSDGAAGTPCEQACGLLDGRLAEIDAAIAELEGLRSSILAARRQPRTESVDAAFCPVIEHA